jgi:catechol 2,3-dioxygenase-like lactoylglutathione lyase family enzyme
MDADNVRAVTPFFRVADMKASLAFYVDGLGFTIDKRWDDRGILRWCSLKLGGASLMLQQFRRKGQDAWAPDGKVGEGVSIFFTCRDAIAVWREATSRGLDASRPEVGNGMWITGLDDPDGYRLEFESATDAPEDSVFDED